MKRNLFLIFSISIGQILFAQTQFQHRYGSLFADYGNRTIQTHDGNFIVVGSTDGFGSSGNVFMMKVDSTGSVLWLKDYAGINYDEAFDVLEVSGKEIIVCGATNSFGAGSVDGFLMKTDSMGNLDWAKSYGNVYGDYFLRINEDGAGGFFVAGYAQKSNGATQGTVLIRVDSFGNVIWKTWVSAWVTQGSDWYPIDLTMCESGGVILAAADDNGSKINCWKFSLSGNLIWSQGYSAISQGHRITEDIYGNVYLTSYQYGVAASVDMAVLKLNSSGVVIWNKSYGGTYVDQARAISKTADGGIVLCGRTNSIGNGDYDACLVKLDSSGSVDWGMAYGTVWYESPTSVTQTSDGGYLMSGFTYSFGNNADSLKIHLVKTDPLGDAGCNSIVWNPIVMNYTITTRPPLVTDTISLQVNPFVWTVNTRSFYDPSICNPTSADEINSMDGFSISPNPFTSRISIAVGKGNMDDCSLTIRNTEGQIVYCAHGKIKTVIDLDFLSQGIYFLEMTADGERAVRKIVKE